jgi:hypothetical protein
MDRRIELQRDSTRRCQVCSTGAIELIAQSLSICGLTFQYLYIVRITACLRHATRATPSLPKFCINVCILFYIYGLTVPCDRCLDRLLKKFGNSGKSALRVFRM